jgi:hypothetical protein
MMRRMYSALARLVLVGGVVASGAAVAPLASAATTAASCSWLTVEAAQVREHPSINSIVRKTVPANYLVGGGRSFCHAVIGTDGRAWHEVYCSCATDRLGYIIANKLYPLTPA